MRASQTCVAAAALFVIACEGDNGVGRSPVGPGAPPAPGPPTGATLALTSGDPQLGRAGEPLEQPLVVRVTDPNGSGLGGITVSFDISAGGGALGGGCEGGTPTRSLPVRTDTEGFAQVVFEPTEIGRSSVSARIAGGTGAPVTFTADATVMVIEFWFGIWYAGFIGPCPFSSHVTVPVGTTVEWSGPAADEQYPMTYTVTSTSAPPGAEGFDSGTLQPKQRFRFVPRVAGTWEYADRITGLTGTLTAR